MKIFKASGQYLGFISDQNIFSWNGTYLGWVNSDNFAWEKDGSFKGFIQKIDDESVYILRNQYSIPPISRQQKSTPTDVTIPSPSSSIKPYNLPLGFIDSF